MAFYGKRRAYNKKRPKSTKKRSTKRRGVSAAVKQYVSRTIKVASENKVVNWSYDGNLYNFNAQGSLWYTYNFFQISPNNSNLQIPQGTGQGNRIGNQIKSVKAVLKFAITPLPYNTLYNNTPIPQNIRVVIFSSKPHPVQLPPFTNFQNYLFQNGNVSQGPINNLMDQISEFNKDEFTIHYDKMVKVGYHGNNGGAGSGGSPINQYLVNNDYKLNIMRSINYTKYLPKLYTYNDSPSVPSGGRSVYVMFIKSNANGVVQVGSQLDTRITMTMDYTFEE